MIAKVAEVTCCFMESVEDMSIDSTQVSKGGGALVQQKTGDKKNFTAPQRHSVNASYLV